MKTHTYEPQCQYEVNIICGYYTVRLILKYNFNWDLVQLGFSIKGYEVKDVKRQSKRLSCSDCLKNLMDNTDTLSCLNP